MKPEKRSVQEQVGVAVNASSLVMREQGESHLDRVAALGAASLAVSLGADVQGVPIAAAAAEVYRRSADMREVMLDPGDVDPRDQLVGELGPYLLHIRDGGQHALLPKAVVLYARWLTHRRLFAEYAGPEHAPLMASFAALVMHEWLSDRCPVCAGSGKQQKSPSGQWIRPRGTMQRNAIFRPCSACNGTRRAAPRHPERMKQLGLTREQYDEGRWAHRFSASIIWLERLISPRILRALTQQLERRTRRA